MVDTNGKSAKMARQANYYAYNTSIRSQFDRFRQIKGQFISVYKTIGYNSNNH